PVFQSLNHASGNVIDLIPAVVKFGVGDRASRRPDGLSIHANHEADQCLTVGERLEDVFSLVIQSGPPNLDKTDVIGASIEDQLLQPSGVQRLLRGRNGRYGLEANPLHGRMIFELHGCSLLYMQLCGTKNQLAPPALLTRLMAWFNCSTKP